jgi:nucleoid-associated protein EbfC
VADKTEDLENFENLEKLVASQTSILQQRLLQARSRLDQAELTGTSGNGAVSVVLSGSGELRAIRVSPGAVDDLNALQRHIMAAHAEAHAAVKKANEDVVVPFTQSVRNFGKLT